MGWIILMIVFFGWSATMSFLGWLIGLIFWVCIGFFILALIGNR